MLLIWKNKGILVMLYIIVSFIGTAMLAGVLKRNFGGVFAKIDFYTTIAVAFFIAGIWTWLTKDDYYKDRNGNKKKMETKHEFFFISMTVWSYILCALGVLFLSNLIFHYFEPF
jgi:ribose/xylose/arabinose/galactoside ABC-type transport system permease subunit